MDWYFARLEIDFKRAPSSLGVLTQESLLLLTISRVGERRLGCAACAGRSGPAGEMILHLRHGIWHEAFLGTNEFCSAHVPKRVLNDLGFRC